MDKKTNMKILHINSYYATSHFYKNLYDLQIQNGLYIDTFVSVSNESDEEIAQLGNYTKISKNFSEIDRVFFHVKQHKMFKDICNTYNINEYSIIHAHSLFTNGFVALKLKEKYHIPYIVAVRNTDINTFFNKMVFLRKIGINILINANAVIFLSNSYRDLVYEKYIPNEFKKDLLDKTYIIPNGIDNFWLENKGHIHQIKDKKKIKLLYVGNVDKNKNIKTILSVVDSLAERNINIQLTVVGKVVDKSLFRLIVKNKSAKYISPKRKEDLIEFYKKNDIFIMPSKYETFGLVYAEAMSQGLPIIYSKGQGFDKQFKEGEVGYHVTYNNVEDIILKINKIIDNYSAISKRCLIKVDKFKWGKIGEEYNKLYYS